LETTRRRTALARGMVAVAVATAALTPGVGGAQEPDPEAERDDVRAQSALVAIEVDALTAEDAAVEQALLDIQANVVARQTALAAAEAAKADADAALTAATDAVAAGEAQVAALEAASDQLVIEAYTTPPGDEGLDMFRAGSLTEAAVKKSLVEMTAQHDADVLAQLEAAQAQLVTDKATKEATSATAATAAADATTALTDVEAALGQQQSFAADVQARLDAKLAQASSLQAQDTALSDQIAREQAALAAQLAASQAPAPTGVQAVPGGLATVDCPAGGSITVAAAIADDLAALLGAAYAAGVTLCGSGYRDPEAQIQLRREHCGTSYYAIYEMPASQCDPPTAIPGTSQHEVGLAIDFTCNGGGTVSRGTTCFSWLSSHADEYGLYNLPTESWHWSTTGN
jgi:LAS superfamily LD-carboxypeptidase LdcB